MVDYLLVEKIISDIKSYIKDLEEAKDISFSKYQEDIRSKRFIERTLHILIESCFDLSNHIISDQGFREPVSYRDIFAVLSENSVISQENLSIYDKIASFRNILVHHYEKIEDSLVFGIFKKDIGDFNKFLKEITRYLESEKKKN